MAPQRGADSIVGFLAEDGASLTLKNEQGARRSNSPWDLGLCEPIEVCRQPPCGESTVALLRDLMARK